jgi:uncharacterized membrane protein YphA (DoxX/SURF4 family)
MLLKLWQHLRLPFSFYLMPVYFFALSISPNFTGDRLLWSFLLIHFFLLPSSHSLASRVEDRSSSAVVVISVVIGIIALAGGFSKVGALFSLLMLIYLLISYFSALTQLKVSANAMLYVLLFIISYTGINEFSMEQALQPSVLIPALLMSFLLMAPFPLIHYRERWYSPRWELPLWNITSIGNLHGILCWCFSFPYVRCLFFFSAGG